MKCFLNKNKLVIFFLIFFLFPNFVFAQTNAVTCSPVGYSIYTINGIHTDLRGAKENKAALQDKLKITTFNNEPIYVDFLLNPTHIAGLGDDVDVVAEKIIENTTITNYDLAEMINDASQKVKTQKILLVSHSEGNFYANNFYKGVAGIGKVPTQSISIYGVATPAGYVAGFGSKYITSSTDKVINKVRSGGILNVLPANIDIKLPDGDNSNGHSFSDVYLKYQGEKIVFDIKSSLSWLSSTVIQDENKPCISPPELTLLHKIQGGALAIIDHPIETTNKIFDATYNTALAIGNGVLNGVTTLASGISSFAQSIFNNTKSLAANNPASVINAVDDTNSTLAENVSQNSPSKAVKKNPSPQVKTAEVTPPPKTIAVSVPTVPNIPVVVFHNSGRVVGNSSVSQTQTEIETPSEEDIVVPESELEPEIEIPPAEDSVVPVPEVDGVVEPEGPASDPATSAAESSDTTAPVITVLGPTVLLGYIDSNGFYFDTPDVLHNFTKTIYRGHYPDTSFISTSLLAPTSSVRSQTIGCGWICSSKKGEYYWFDINSDEGHYIFEVRRTGLEWEWEVIDPFSNVVLSSLKQISSFQFQLLTPESFGIIDEINHTIFLTVSPDTDLTRIIPGVLVSDLAFLDPPENIPQDFTNPVIYKVTAQDHSVQDYVVTVTVE